MFARPFPQPWRPDSGQTKSRPRRLLSTTRYRLDFEDKVVDLRPDIDIRASHSEPRQDCA